MNRGLSALALAALLAVGIAGGVGLAGKLDRAPAPDPATLDNALILQSSFNRAAAIATKAVVHITIEGLGTDNVGSGVIVTPKGHIVTNYHVVRDNLPCRVRFVDGSEYVAEITGRDPDSDLAVLKIDPMGRDLQPIVIADSDKVRVGDIVFAIGSPFGYTHTVTSGIVSAKHRRLELDKPYEDYLQTDAAINPGNSGGALVNLRGELVGVNSAMVSGSRTNDGVGLAIASNLVKWVQERLIRDGQVRRGRLGILGQEFSVKDMALSGLLVTPELRAAATNEELARLLGLTEPAGAVITNVFPGTPAGRVPLKPLDVITEVDGRPIRTIHELALRVSELEPGRKVKLKYVRNRKVLEATVTLSDRQDPISLPPASRP